MQIDFNIPSITLGNTARLFFQKWESVAKILRVPEFLVKDLGTIWFTLTSDCTIDSQKFGDFCNLFNEKFKLDQNINWYQFCPTLHKILVHGQQCMEYFDIPIGWLSEEASFSFKLPYYLLFYN